MLEQVTVKAPQIDFPLTIAGSLAAKRVLYLENLLEPHITVPEVFYLTRCFIWNQFIGDYAAGTYGDVGVSIDPGKQFIKASGFPITETVAVKYNKFIGALEIGPGKSHYVVEKFDPPIAYRPYRDAILVAPECNDGVGEASVFIEFGFLAEADIAVPPEEAIPSGATDVYRITLDTDSPGNVARCIRNVVPTIATGGTQIRVHVSALASPMVLHHLSVGVRSGGTSSTIATPVELKFNGSSGCTVGPHSGAWSDWTDFITAQGQELLVTASLFDASNNWAFKSAHADGCWISSSDSWDNAVMQGSPFFHAGSHVIDRVQVK